MKAVYRVHTVVTYPDGHPIREKAIRDSGQHWKEHEINATKWDIVIAPGVEQACEVVRGHYEADGVIVKRIYSLNHFGDVTLEWQGPSEPAKAGKHG